MPHPGLLSWTHEARICFEDGYPALAAYCYLLHIEEHPEADNRLVRTVIRDCLLAAQRSEITPAMPENFQPCDAARFEAAGPQTPFRCSATKPKNASAPMPPHSAGSMPWFSPAASERIRHDCAHCAAKD